MSVCRIYVGLCILTKLNRLCTKNTKTCIICLIVNQADNAFHLCTAQYANVVQDTSF